MLLQLQVEAVADAPKTLTLDTRDLTLHKVTLLSGSPAAVAAAPGAVVEEAGAAAAEQSLQYALAEKHPVSMACALPRIGVQHCNMIVACDDVMNNVLIAVLCAVFTAAGTAAVITDHQTAFGVQHLLQAM